MRTGGMRARAERYRYRTHAGTKLRESDTCQECHGTRLFKVPVFARQKIVSLYKNLLKLEGLCGR
jgi:hypothetical protein